MKYNTDKLAARISNLLLKTQNQFAVFMNKSTSKFSMLSMKLMFITICLIFISLSVFFIIDAFTGEKPKSTISHIHFIPLQKEKEQPSIIVTATVYKRLQLFKSYMDSIKLNNRHLYDSINITRPGLLDSAAILEKLYLSQSIK